MSRFSGSVCIPLLVSLGLAACAAHAPMKPVSPPRSAVITLHHPYDWREARWADRDVPLRIEGPASVVFVWWKGGRDLALRRVRRELCLGSRSIASVWTGLSDRALLARLAERRHWPDGWLVLDAQALTPRLVARLRQMGPLRLGVVCPLKRVCPLDALVPLRHHIVGLSLKDALVPPGFHRVLRRLRRIRYLSLRGLRVAHATPPERRRLFFALAALRELRTLDLGGTRVDDRALAALARLPRLRWLDLMASRVAGPGLAHLARVRTLRYLGLAATAIGDAPLSQVARLSDLRVLDLAMTHVSDSGLYALRRLSRLRALDLADVTVTDLGMPAVATLTRLRILQLPHHISDVGLATIRGLGELEVLGLRRAAITDEGLSHLRGLGHLRRVDLTGTDVRSATLRRLGFRIRHGADDSDRVAERPLLVQRGQRAKQPSDGVSAW